MKRPVAKLCLVINVIWLIVDLVHLHAHGGIHGDPLAAAWLAINTIGILGGLIFLARTRPGGAR